MVYLWGLGSSGWANSYYAAAAQAGTQNWKAWLFGSLDAGNAITVDKPPAAMWVMGLSGRIFGFNEFTMLLPEALMGVGAVAVLYLTVKRTSGPSAGLVAGLVLALTPVATLMFPVQQPGCPAGAVARDRGLLHSARHRREHGQADDGLDGLDGLRRGLRVPHQDAAGIPSAARLRAGVPRRGALRLWKRLGALLVGGATMIVSAGWFIALVSLWAR